MAIQAATQLENVRIIQLIVFLVGDDEYGVPIHEVHEIIRAGEVTSVPDSPRFVQGLINVRGDIVAAIDLRARFQVRTGKTQESKHTIITRQQDNLFGVMVDEVTEVLRIPETDIKPPPKVVTSLHDAYVMGVLPLENRLIILLDLERMLSEEELTRLAAFTRSAGASPEPGNQEVRAEEFAEPGFARQAPDRESAGSKRPSGALATGANRGMI